MNSSDEVSFNLKRAEIVLDIINNTDPDTFIDFDIEFYKKMSESKAKGEDLWLRGEEEFYRKQAWSKDKQLVKVYNLKRISVYYLILFFSLLITVLVLWRE